MKLTKKENIYTIKQQINNKASSYRHAHIRKFKLKLKLKEEYDMMRKLHIFKQASKQTNTHTLL